MHKDFVLYIDTDGMYIDLWQWLVDQGIDIDKWNDLDQDRKIEYIKRISSEIEDYVNKKSYEITQKQHYNSQVDDFSITFEQEKIAFSSIYSTKKRYALWTIEDKIEVTGLEIVRSDSPEIVKPMIKKILEMVLKSYEDNEIKSYISDCKRRLRECEPEEIAENKGINHLDKYLINNGHGFIKGTPHQIKGVANFKYLLSKFSLENEYEIPQNGNKAKIVYLQRNPYNINDLSFFTYPKEFFDKGIQINYNRMIENNFTKKVRSILSLVGKERLLKENIDIMSIFK